MMRSCYAVVCLGMLLSFSCILQAQEADLQSGQVGSVVPPVAADQAVVPGTSAVLQGVAWPGSHSFATNQHGVPVHSFSMLPVVTNITLLTNDLPRLERRSAELEREVNAMPLRERQLRDDVIRSRVFLMNVATNFVPVDDEGKALKAKIEKLGKELQALSADYKRLLEADPAYKQAKAKMDADVEAYRDLSERKGALREERRQVMAELQKINLLRTRAVPVPGPNPAAGAGDETGRATTGR